MALVATLEVEAAPGRLPLPSRHLVGREREVALIRRRLLHDGARLLTLTGTGGVGKTSLAIAVAAGLESEFEEGVRFVDLSPVQDAALVLPELARACGVRVEGGHPPLEMLRRMLGVRSLLVVVDNFEQVLDAAPGIGDLLEACPSLRMLVTSREALRLRWEWELQVPPLPLPKAQATTDVADVQDNPAVALFVERARAVQPGFELTPGNASAVAELCVKLDGLPLAIELAAARTRLLPPVALLARLGSRLDLESRVVDAPARHRTLREAMGWSHDLLTAEQRVLFRRLAIFVGGCSLEAAEAVCVHDVLDGLAALVDRSLLISDESPASVAHGGVRFRMLETVRELALERLEESGEIDVLRAAHAEYFHTLAEAAEVGGRGVDQHAWLDSLDRDLDNVRAALRGLLDRGDTESLDVAAHLGWLLWQFWWARGFLAEGRRWMAEILAAGDAAPPLAQARAAWVIAGAALDQGDYAAAPPHIAQCLELFRALGDVRGEARALLMLGYAAPIDGDLEAALEAHRRSASRFRQAGDEQGVALALAGLANTAVLAGDLAVAAARNEEALGIARGLGDTHTQAQVLEALGLCEAQRQDHARALAYFRQSVPLCLAVESVELFCYCLVGLAGLAQATGASERAARLLGAAERLREQRGLGVWPVRQSLQAELVAGVRGALDDETFASAWAAGRAMPLSAAARYAIEEEAPVFVPAAAAVAVVDASRANNSGLSPRELEVALLIARGKTSKEIAEVLVITERTADTHAAHIRDKLGLRSRAEIAAWVVKRNLGEAR